MNLFYKILFSTLLTSLGVISIALAEDPLPVTIPDFITTEFGIYIPCPVQVDPQVEAFDISPDFHDVGTYSNYEFRFTETDSLLLQKNYFTVKKSPYKQLYDVYNACTWDSTPVFITTDAVLHIYHVMFDQFLQQIEISEFIPLISSMTATLLSWTEAAWEKEESGDVKEALRRNMAFFSVAGRLIRSDEISVPPAVQALVDSEMTIIDQQDGFQTSPIFGAFNLLDYSQFKPRGHYTASEMLKAYFRACMWYGHMHFTMEQDLFGPLAERHTLQAILLVQALYSTGKIADWGKIYDPTVFFVGKTDDPDVRNYMEIAEDVYGTDFLTLAPDSLAEPQKLNLFMLKARELPEPMIPNWIYGTFTTYKGFRFMGQRFVPDSYMFSRLVLPYVNERTFPKGLDIMAILGSERAYSIIDSVYHATELYDNYSEQLFSLREEFLNQPAEKWAQNLYWNWLYTLMPLLYEKSPGYPHFMQTLAWTDKELMTALASWTELRHDVILYAKQSMSPCCIPPGPPKSYVEPNPYLYARLLSLCRFTLSGLENRGLLLEGFTEKLQLFDDLLCFLLEISIKELENLPISDAEYENMYCFGKVMQKLVAKIKEPYDPWNCDVDDMAIIADVHTDSNTDHCLEEGVGYPLELFVIVNHGGYKRLTRGAIFSYYEFLQPISNRLTDEAWRKMLAGEDPPKSPAWLSSFFDLNQDIPEVICESPDNLFHKEFTSIDQDLKEPLPDKSALYQNYPNPFNSSTTIYYRVESHSGTSLPVELTIFNILGQKIETLVIAHQAPGEHRVSWYAGGFPSGLYYCRISIGNHQQVRKMILLR